MYLVSAVFITVGGSKEAIIYGYEHPQYNYNLAWKLLFISLFASLIIPGIYIVVFVGYFIKMVVEYIQKKRRVKARR